MIKFNKYENDLDKSWYDSSNVFYSECDDHDNDLKTVRVTFSNGRTYEYEKVNVTDYLMFRNSPSQGTAFNQYIRKYENKRIEDRDMNLLNEELNNLLNPQTEEEITHVHLSNRIIITDKDNNVVMDERINAEEKQLLRIVFNHLNIRYKEDND